MPRTILVITNVSQDLHGQVVKTELERRGYTVVCFDPATVIAGTVAFHCENNSAFSSIIKTDECLDLSEVTSVLYRRPSPIPQDDRLTQSYRSVVRDEWEAYLGGTWRCLSSKCLWVSNPDSIRIAESKLLQLELAPKLGLRIPSTLVTNDYQQLLAFARETGPAVIIKKLKTHCIISNEGSALFVARRFNSFEEIEPETLQYCPIVAQEFVAKRFDARVIVIGSKVFAVAIASQENPKTQIDYRAGTLDLAKLPHHTYELPRTVERACVAMVRKLGLEFGAFDFAITADDEHIFLELNPNGQWLWLQLATGVDIVSALCDHLCSGKLPSVSTASEPERGPASRNTEQTMPGPSSSSPPPAEL